MVDYLCVKALWGMEGSLEYQFAAIHEAGYGGVEGTLPLSMQKEEFCSLLKQYGFHYIPQIHTEGPDHFDSFQRQIEQALIFSPPLINSHTGRDTLLLKERSALFEKIIRFEEQISVPIGHETHRSRSTFSPMATLELVREFPSLQLTADFSHWCCVCESLLEDQEKTMAEIIKQVIHIHGRVGYRQGPQVPDPAAPEYARELTIHEAWWRAIALERREQKKVIVFCPEYGPAVSRYLHTLPYTDQPVASLWQVCLWAGDRFKTHVIDKL